MVTLSGLLLGFSGHRQHPCMSVEGAYDLLSQCLHLITKDKDPEWEQQHLPKVREVAGA